MAKLSMNCREQSYEDQMTTNLVAVIFSLVLLIGGYSLLVGMHEALQSEQCLLTDWRTCGRLDIGGR